MNAHNYKHPIIFIHFLNKLDTAGMIILLFIIITNFKVAFYQKKNFKVASVLIFKSRDFDVKWQPPKPSHLKKHF